MNKSNVASIFSSAKVHTIESDAAGCIRHMQRKLAQRDRENRAGSALRNELDAFEDLTRSLDRTATIDERAIEKFTVHMHRSAKEYARWTSEEDLAAFSHRQKTLAAQITKINPDLSEHCEKNIAKIKMIANAYKADRDFTNSWAALDEKKTAPASVTPYDRHKRPIESENKNGPPMP